MFPGIVIAGVYLNGQILFGVNEFDQDGQFTVRVSVTAAQIFGVCPQHIGERLARERSAGCDAGPVRVGGTFPGLGQRLHGNAFGKIIIEPVAAPKVIFAHRAQQEWFSPQGGISVCHGR